MNIALPILLLVFGGLTFWILSESTVRWYVKTICISVFCLFTIIFWTSLHSFLGWPANQDDLPEKILVHWVVIKEPNKARGFNGAIYILLESAEEIKKNKISKVFGYKNERIEPRLFELDYSRELHEKLESLKSKLKSGQPVLGKLSKEKKEGKKGQKGGEKGDPKKKGDGSESQEQDWEFHELSPSDFQGKPE